MGYVRIYYCSAIPDNVCPVDDQRWFFSFSILLRDEPAIPVFMRVSKNFTTNVVVKVVIAGFQPACLFLLKEVF